MKSYKFKIKDFIRGTEELKIPVIDREGNPLDFEIRMKIKNKLLENDYNLIVFDEEV